MINKRLLTPKEVSEYLGISVKGIYNMVYRRQIPFVKIGGRLKFDIRDIDNWIEENKVKDVNSLLNEKFKV